MTTPSTGELLGVLGVLAPNRHAALLAHLSSHWPRLLRETRQFVDSEGHSLRDITWVFSEAEATVIANDSALPAQFCELATELWAYRRKLRAGFICCVHGLVLSL